jgi:hypothetical protein
MTDTKRDTQKTDRREVWFAAKKYGWGWGPPVTWQGWVVMIVWIVLFTGGLLGIMALPEALRPLLLVLYVVVMVAALITICYMKGETPRWRWGGDD